MSHFIRRQDTFYFNKRLPLGLSSKRPVVRFSLQTKDRRIARYLAALLAYKLETHLEINPTVDLKLLISQCRTWLPSQNPINVHNGGTLNQLPISHESEQLDFRDVKCNDFGSLLSQCFTLYEEENLQAESWADKSHTDVKAAVDTFIEIVGDIPAHLLSEDHARNYKTTLMKYPKQRTILSKLKGKPLTEILKEPSSYTPLSPVTINNQLRKTRSFLNWCLSNKYVEINHLHGLKVIEKKYKEARLSFTHDDIEYLFNDKIFKEKNYEDSWQYWLPLIGALTGCRMEEIAQLYIDDICKHGDYDCFKITDEREDQKLKNFSSRRLVPIHKQLVELGLLEYVDQLKNKGETRLFPELKAVRGKYGHTPSKWYSKYKQLKIVDHDRKSFHSFRHTAIDELRNEGVSDSIVKLIVGHADSSMTFGRYGSRLPLKEMTVAVNKIPYIKIKT